jgi:hypothetical protein
LFQAHTLIASIVAAIASTGNGTTGNDEGDSGGGLVAATTAAASPFPLVAVHRLVAVREE